MIKHKHTTLLTLLLASLGEICLFPLSLSASEFSIHNVYARAPILNVAELAGDHAGLVLISRAYKEGSSFLPCNVEIVHLDEMDPRVVASLEALSNDSGFFDAGDVDQDGDLDIITTTPKALVVYYQKNGTFEKPQKILPSDSYLGLLKSAGKSFGNLKELRHIKLLFDMDKDGKMDIILPIIGGVSIYYQKDQAHFDETASTKLSMDIYVSGFARDSGSMSLSLPQPIIKNINSDDLPDIVLYGGSGLRLYTQDNKRSFTLQDWIILDDFEDIVHRPRLVPDLDQDGWHDIVNLKTKEEGMKQMSTLDFYFHTPTGYPTTPQESLSSDAFFTELFVTDMNGDGLLDLSIPAIKIGLGMLTSAFSGKIKIQNLVYCQVDKGHFNETPHISKYKINQKYGVFEQGGDFNGDGRSDLLIAPTEDQLEIRLAESGNGHSSKTWKTITVKVSSRITILDVNHDGVSDIIMLGEEDRQHVCTLILSKK